MKRTSTLVEKRSVHFADTMPKIGVAAVDVRSAENLSWLSGISIMTLSIEGSTLQLDEDGSTCPLTSVPVQMLGFLVLSKAGEAEIERIRSEWRDTFRCEAPPVFDAKAGVDPIAVLSWQSERLINLQHEATRRNTVLMRDLAAVRVAHDELQEAFRRLEAFAVANLALIQEEVLTLEPMRHGVRMVSGSSGLIVQRMPLNSVGVSDVALHINRLSADSKGSLKIRLRTVEDDQAVGNWTVPAHRLRPGWLRLSLREALSIDERSLELAAHWEGEGEVILSLSNKHPDERWCARQGSRSLDRVLAHQAWRALPGTRANRSPNAIPVDDAPVAGQWIIDAEPLRTVELINGPPGHVIFIEDKRAILVHPVDQTSTVARIPRACPVGARHVWAQVETTNPEAATVEYALAVMPALEADGAVPQLTSPGAHVSEWRAVPPGKKTEIHLFLPEPAQEPADLYLATRMPPGVSNANCQAYFSLIRASA